MLRSYTNTENISLALAVFLATDTYDKEDSAISATGLIKPLRQLVLGSRVPLENTSVDVAGLVQSRVGTAIHEGVDSAWNTNYIGAMKALGYPPGLIARIKINPTDEMLLADPNIVPIYTEQRAFKEVDGVVVSGKYDFVIESEVQDLKTTTTYTHTHNTKEEDYILQGSIYRWLDPKRITKDTVAIHSIFMDWKAHEVHSQKNYPPSRLLTTRYNLLSLPETESFVRQKLSTIKMYSQLPESEVPLCTDKELWRSEAQFKYYAKSPTEQSRSTKNFNNKQAAQNHLMTKGKGVVVEKPGEVKACKFCTAFTLCTQKDSLLADGSLKL